MDYVNVVFKHNVILLSHKDEWYFVISHVNGWNWRILSQVTLAQFRRPEATGSPSYVVCRPKTNAAILWDTGHTKGRLYK
jgi:hypothetical protein